MGRISDDYTNALLDALLGSNLLGINDVEFGLSSTDPTDDGSGITEPTGGSYARPNYPNDATTWNPAAARTKTNLADIEFPAATGDWGDNDWLCVFDLATHDYIGNTHLAATLSPGAGDTVAFLADSLVFRAPGS